MVGPIILYRLRGVESVGDARKGVEQLPKTYDARVRELAQMLRKLVKKTLLNAVETVKWGNPMYLLDGKNLSWIVGYKDHADLGSSRRRAGLEVAGGMRKGS